MFKDISEALQLRLIGIDDIAWQQGEIRQWQDSKHHSMVDDVVGSFFTARAEDVAEDKVGDVLDGSTEGEDGSENPNIFCTGPEAKCYNSKLCEEDYHAYLEFRTEIKVEQAIRTANAEFIPPLLPMGDDQLNSFRKVLPQVRAAAAEAFEKRRHQAVLNEADCRLAWDKILSAVFSGAVLEKDDHDARVGYFLERRLQTSQNDFWNRVCNLKGKAFNKAMDAQVQLLQQRLPASTVKTPDERYPGRGVDEVATSLRETFVGAYNEAAEALETLVSNRNTERTLAAATWFSNSSLDGLQARVLKHHEYSTSDGAIVLAIPDVFPSNHRNLAKAFCPVKGFYDQDKAGQPDSAEGEPEENKSPAVSTTTMPPVVTRDAAGSMHALLISARQAAESLLRGYGMLENQTGKIPAARGGESSATAHTGEPAQAKSVPASKKTDAAGKGKSSSPSKQLVVKRLAILFAILLVEFKKGLVSPLQGINQAIHYIEDSVYNLNAAGIQNFPVFAIAAVGFKARLLTAWGELRKDDNENDLLVVRLADTNCPQWDICNCSEAFRLAIFLIHVRDVWSKKLAARFTEEKEQYRLDWEAIHSEDSKLSGRFSWRMEDQKQGQACKELQAKVDAEVAKATALKVELIEKMKAKAEAKAEAKAKAKAKAEAQAQAQAKAKTKAKVR